MAGNKSPNFGLYRRRQLNKKTGQWEDVGAYIRDMRIPRALLNQFAGLKPRIMKSTEVMPGTRNAVTTVGDMKGMVKDLIRERDVDTLMRIQKDKLSLSSAFAKWRQGRLHLAEQYPPAAAPSATDAPTNLQRPCLPPPPATPDLEPSAPNLTEQYCP